MPANRSLTRKRQTRLSFDPAASMPLVHDYSPAVQDRLAHVRFEGAKTRSRTRDRSCASPPHDNSSSSPSNKTRSPVLQPISPLSTELDDEDVVLPSTKKQRVYANPSLDTPDSGLRRQSTRLTLQSSPVTRVKPAMIDHDDSPVTMRFSRRQARSQQSSSAAQSSHIQFREDNLALHRPVSEIGSAETSDDGDDVMATQPTKRRSGRQAQTNTDFTADDNDVEYASFNNRSPSSFRRSKTKSQKDDFVVGNDEVEYLTSDSDQVVVTSSKSRKSKTPRDIRVMSRTKQRELEEDLLDLRDSEQELTVESRTRGGPVQTERDKTRAHFELLRQRRTQPRRPRVIESDESDVVDIEDEDTDAIDINGISDTTKDREWCNAGQNNSTHPSMLETLRNGSDCSVDNDLDEDDFIVDDRHEQKSGRLGRPNPAIPLQFTSFASAKPKELFPHIIEWMVKNKISPAFQRDDDVYKLSISRIDDQVKAQAGSRLISAAWNASFKQTILARPDMTIHALPGLDEDNIRTCDACNKTNHPARYEFQFSGQAYSHQTLEPVETSDNEDNDDDDGSQADAASYDEQGHLLAPRTTRFFLGRYCAANAEMGHKLTHWKHKLNQEVLSHLDEQGVLSAEAIVARDRQNNKKREKAAESIVDTMQETGMIAQLWQGFQDDLDDARIGMEGFERKGGRGKQRIGNVRYQTADGAIGEWTEGGKHQWVALPQPDDDSEGGLN